MSDNVTLASFEVRELLGEGGMGRVYRALHRRTGVPVALKVVAAETDARAARRLQEEVQAHAGLHHPAIVHLFEYGTVGEAEVAAPDGPIAPGSPYVAMEYAPRGTLREAMPVSNWPIARALLLHILDALAHAHARGVIHRDLKPENLLMFEGDERRSGPPHTKLADFGIAHALEGQESTASSWLTSPVGTISYMAPEQLRAEWRRYGPWTDLYSLGCLAWELVCGRPPFEGDSRLAVAMRHQKAPRPQIDPSYEVPDGLEAWLHRAMATDPEHRFRRAADAAWALPTSEAVESRRTTASHDAIAPDEADEATQRTAPTVAYEGSRRTTLTFHGRADEATTLEAADLSSTAEVSSPPGTEAASREASEIPSGPPPTPETWDRETSEPLATPLIGMGLGLFGLRETPFVDRERERERIWEALRRVEQEDAPGVILLVGESGAGKSRLAEWMTTRAHEVGAAEILKAVHDRGGPSPASGLSGMVRRALQGWKLDRGDFHEHLLAHLPPLPDDASRERDARALTEMVFPTDDGDELEGPVHRFSGSDELHALVDRFVVRMARNRTPMVWIDDAQWNPLAMGWMQHLLSPSFETTPALVVATLRSDELVDRPELAEDVENLVTADRCRRFDLGPLGATDHRRLIERMLPLSGELVDAVASRTEGNPLFATQLLGELVDEGELTTGSEGFSLPEGTSPNLPDDVHELWHRRLQRLVSAADHDEPEVVWRTLERAAALGREVDADEWSAVCAQIGLDAPERLRDELVRRGLAERTDEGWAFAHGLLVDSLEHRARETDRWAQHNRRCVELLENTYSDRPQIVSYRRAEHWIAAGQLENALEPLWSAFDRGRKYDDGADRALEILKRREQVLEELDVPETDPVRIENDILVTRLRLTHGDPPGEVVESLEDARRRAEQISDDRLLASARTQLSAVRRLQGDTEAACAEAKRATASARDTDDAQLRAKALIEWAWAGYFRGNLVGADRRFSEVVEETVPDIERRLELESRQGIAWVALGKGEYDRAKRLFEETLQITRTEGFRNVEKASLNGLADIAKFRGDADEARRRYRQYRRISRKLNHLVAVANAHRNLAEVEVLAGNFERAAQYLEESLSQKEDISRAGTDAQSVRANKIALASGRRDWNQFDELIGAWPDDARLFKDHPWLVEIAGDYAEEADERERADRAWRLARTLYEKLGDSKAASRCETKLDG